MIAAIEVIRIVGAVLKDPLYGVNPQLFALDIDEADTRPPEVKAILLESDDDIEIDEAPEDGFPALLVLESDLGVVADPEAPVGYRDGYVYVDIIYVRAAARKRDRWRDARYTGQAVVNSLEKGLLAAGMIESAGIRNDVQILQATQLSAPRIEQQQGKAMMAGAIRYAFNFRHNKA